jgi:two-component system osmolarity sensor histidine kinase EnvZ
MRLPGSILWRTSIVILVALVLSEITTVTLMEQYEGRPRTEARVANFVGHLKTISAALETMSDDVKEEFIRRIAVSEGVRVIRGGRAPEGLAIAPNTGNLKIFRQRFQEAFGPQMEIYVRPEDQTAPRSLLWVRMTIPPQDEYWIGIPRRHIEPFSTTATILWSVAGIAIALLASFFIIWRLNRPLAALASAADAIGTVDDAGPLPQDGPSEIRAVTLAFNRMMDRLRHIERERATFLAGISHDLRTPLSHVRLELSMVKRRLDDQTRRDILTDLEDMNAILDNFIDFARAEVGEACSPVNLSELADECAERVKNSGARVELQLAELPLLDLRPLAMHRLVNNLLANAVRHGGGDLVVRTAVDQRNVVFSVFDRGPGIPPDDAERLKQPFAHKDDSRGGAPGAGLGLAIADRIARLHGGKLELLPRDGGGLEARVTLPTGGAEQGALQFHAPQSVRSDVDNSTVGTKTLLRSWLR